METLHLLRSPANAKALFESLEQARSGKAVTMTLDELKARWKKRVARFEAGDKTRNSAADRTAD